MTNKKNYKRFRITFSDIEWDVGKDPIADGYDLDVIAQLPKSETYEIQAPDVKSALQWAISDIEQNNGFSIKECRSQGKEI